MSRLRLRDHVALIDRSDDSVLVSPTALVLPPLTAAERRWLAEFDGGLTYAELLECAPSTRAEALLSALESVGVIVDDAVSPALRMCTAPERIAMLAERDTLALAFGDSELAMRVIERRRSTRVAVLGEGTLARSVREALICVGLTLVQHHPHVTVIAERGHVDVFDDDGCTSLDTPHLQLRAHAHRSRIGPFVIPGQTSCLRCAHGFALDADPDWGSVSLRLARASRRQDVSSPVLLHHTVAFAVSALTAWIDNGSALSESVEISLPGPVIRTLDRPFHPVCGCQWKQPARRQVG